MSTRYVVQHENETLLVTVTEERGGYRIEMDGESIHVDYRQIANGSHRSLLMNGLSFEVATMPGRPGLDVFVSGEVYHLKVTDELWARAEEAAHGGDAGGEEILAPMPGAVVRIAVEMDQIVPAGETVVVVEAMKMQNDVTALIGGRVTEIRSAQGAVVEQGAVLVVLSPQDGNDNG